VRSTSAAVVAVVAVLWVLLLPAPAAAQCLTGGIVSACEDPIRGLEPRATVDGGKILPEGGFRVEAKGDHITVDFGVEVTAARVRFTISNVSPANLDQDTHLVFLATETPELTNPSPTRVFEFKIWGGLVDPAAQGTSIVGAGDGTNESSKRVGVLEWKAGTTYQIDISWDDAAQMFSFARDGDVLVDHQIASGKPVVMRYRYFHFSMPYMGNKVFWPVIKSIYGMYSVAVDATSEPFDAGMPDAGTADTGLLDSSGLSDLSDVSDVAATPDAAVDAGKSDVALSDDVGAEDDAGGGVPDAGGTPADSGAAPPINGGGDAPPPAGVNETTAGCSCAAVAP